MLGNTDTLREANSIKSVLKFGNGSQLFGYKLYLIFDVSILSTCPVWGVCHFALSERTYETGTGVLILIFIYIYRVNEYSWVGVLYERSKFTHAGRGVRVSYMTIVSQNRYL
jgi:hypothetical protein